MRRVWRKISRCELLVDYILCSALTVTAGGLLIMQIAKITIKASLSVSSTRFTMFFVAAFLAIVLLTGFALYRKSAAYIAWYKEILNAVPMPLIVTGEEAEWLQINKAACEVVDMKGKHGIEHLNSRHLLNEDGSVMNRTWLHNGKNYQVAGKPLRCGGRYAGYLIFLNDAPEGPESVQIHTELLGKIHEHIKCISKETEYLRGCAGSISGHIAWQSGRITELIAIIDGIASSGLNDPEALVEKMDFIKADIRYRTKKAQSDLEQMRQIVSESKHTRDFDESSPSADEIA